MEFRIAADELKKALFRAQGIVERKATMPILSNVLVNATKSGVTVTAFDLDIGIVSEHQAEVLKPGAVTVSGPTLVEMVRKSSYAISTDETRYVLNGVFFEPKEGGRVRMVATDGHRLAMVDRELPGDFKLKAGVIIPRKGLFELKRLLDEAPEAEMQLGFAENSALFKKPGLSMVMRLIDGQFPEYQRVIPKEGEKQLLVNRGRFSDALKRIALLSADKSNAVKVSLSENLLRITANNPDLGEAKDDLEVAYRGASLTVGFNARYIQDVLAAMDGDEVALELGDEHSPGVLHAPGDRSHTAVVMPMRV